MDDRLETAQPSHEVPLENRKTKKHVKWMDQQTDRMAAELLKEFADTILNKDNIAVFCDHVANKIRSYSLSIRAEVEHKINCVLHEADMQSIWESNAEDFPNSECPELPCPDNSSAAKSANPPKNKKKKKPRQPEWYLRQKSEKQQRNRLREAGYNIPNEKE